MGASRLRSGTSGSREPRRLLLVLHRGDVAGTERHVLWLATALLERGWEVSLAVSQEGPILEQFEAAGIEVVRLARRRGFGFAYTLALACLARERSIDVMHVHSGRLAAAAGRVAGVRAVLETRHGLGPLGEPPGRRRLRREAWRCRLAHRTLTVCRSDRQRLIEGGMPEGRVVAIPNGIPERTEGALRPAVFPGPPRLGFLGRLVVQKDPLFLARLGRALERRFPEGWELLIAGDGPLRSRLAGALQRAGIAGRIRWLGETEGPAALLDRTDLLLVPSCWEGQPLAILEAMQAGVVVLARRLASLEELLGGRRAAGILLPADPQGWATAIAELASDPARHGSLLEEARERVERDHRLETMVDRVERAYRDCFASPRGP